MSSNPLFTDEFKKNLRSVLLSKAGGVEINRILADYQTYVGQPLMYRKYGFPDVQSLLRALPDVAQYVLYWWPT